MGLFEMRQSEGVSSSSGWGEEGTSEAGEEQTILWTTWHSAHFSCSFFFDCFVNYEKGVDPRNRMVGNLDASVFHLSKLREYRLTVSTFTCVKFYLRRGKNYKQISNSSK